MLSRSGFRTAFFSLFSLLGLGAATGVVRAQPPPPAVAGLPEDLLPGLAPILKAAATRAPDAVRSSIEIEKAEGRRDVGRAPMLPNASGSARYAVNDESVSGNNATSNRSSGFFYDFSVRQPIYQWGALKAQADHEKIGAKIAERQYAQAYQQLLVTLRREYLRAVMQKATLRTLRSQLAFDEGEVTTQQQRLKDGLGTPGQVALAEQAVEQRKLAIDIAVSTLAEAKRSIQRLAGIEPLADDAIPDDFPRPTAQDTAATALLQSFAQGGIYNTPVAQMYAMSIKQAEQDYIVAQHRLYPKFSIYADYNIRSETQASANSIDQVAVKSLNYGVVADWSVFDGFATGGMKTQALASKRGSERQLQYHVEATVDAARAQREQLGFAARGLDITERSIFVAQAVLKDIQGEFAVGRRAQADVDKAKFDLAKAQADILPARAEYLMKWTEFVSLVGADPAMNNLPSRYVR